MGCGPCYGAAGGKGQAGLNGKAALPDAQPETSTTHFAQCVCVCPLYVHSADYRVSVGVGLSALTRRQVNIRNIVDATATAARTAPQHKWPYMNMPVANSAP